MIQTLRNSTQVLSTVWQAPRALVSQWAYTAVDSRDLRLDFLRGLAVFAMIVNHWGGPSWLYIITGGNAFFVSAAEAFVFISGLVVGIVYGKIAQTQGLKVAVRKALLRAFTLYKLTVVLTLVFAAVSIYAGFGWVQDLQIDNVLSFVFRVATFRQTVFLTDIPLVYTLLMLAAPMGLGCLVKNKTAWLVMISSALWLATQFYPNEIQLPWQVSSSGTFSLAAWQLLFFVGMAMGYHRQAVSGKLSRIPRVPLLMVSGALLIWLIQIYVTNANWLLKLFPNLNPSTFLADLTWKSTLAPGRVIAAVVVFLFAYLMATVFWQPLHKFLGWFLMPLGQNALYSYTMHVVVIGVLAYVIPKLPTHIMSLDPVNTVVQLSGVFVIWIMIHRRVLFRIVPR